MEREDIESNNLDTKIKEGEAPKILLSELWGHNLVNSRKVSVTEEVIDVFT